MISDDILRYVLTMHIWYGWRNYKDTDGMLARWLAKLEVYNFDAVHRAGKSQRKQIGASSFLCLWAHTCYTNIMHAC